MREETISSSPGGGYGKGAISLDAIFITFSSSVKFVIIDLIIERAKFLEKITIPVSTINLISKNSDLFLI